MTDDQKRQDDAATNVVRDALHALNAALSDARARGLTADVTPSVINVVGGPPIVSLSARLFRQRIEFDRKF